MNESANSPQLIAIAVVEHDGRYLIRERPEGAPLAGFWEFPGGNAMLGESAARAAERECLEETGLAARAVEMLCEVDHVYAHGTLRLSFYRCAPQRNAESPGGDFRWVDGTALETYEFPPANATVLEILFRRRTAFP